VLLNSVAYAWSPQGCYDLWLKRNLVYKVSGYCFKTADAIATFGNASCLYDDISNIPLSDQERNFIAKVSAIEKKVCRG
jgi:hypothetical protein